MAMDSKECYSLLPFELVEEILSRVPTKSLIRLKLTCKRWLSLFQDKKFIYTHLALLQDQQIIRTTSQMVKIIDQDIGACSSLSLPYEFQLKPEIRIMVHCDGLFLCILESGAMAVWNPCLNQVRWIKLHLPTYPVCFCFGIGYDSLSHDGYKILRFADGSFTKNEEKNTGSYIPDVYIYEFKSGSWKTIVNVSMDWNVVLRCRGVSIKGNMYWIAKWKCSKVNMFFIQSFNFSSETFEPLCSSLPFEYSGASDVVALSAFRGDKLSLLHKSEETGKMEVWVTNKVSNKAVSISWTKIFSVTRPDHLPVLMAYENIADPVHYIDKKNRLVVCCEEVLADKRNVAVNVYLIGEGEIKRQAEIDRHLVGYSWPFISGYAYLPSLVPVPNIGGI